jgi:hypothetical protein
LLDDLAVSKRAGQPTGGRAVVDGDSADGTGANLARLNQQGLTPMVETGMPTAPGGRFAQISAPHRPHRQTVSCLAQVAVAILPCPIPAARDRPLCAALFSVEISTPGWPRR